MSRHPGPAPGGAGARLLAFIAALALYAGLVLTGLAVAFGFLR